MRVANAGQLLRHRQLIRGRLIFGFHRVAGHIHLRYRSRCLTEHYTGDGEAEKCVLRKSEATLTTNIAQSLTSLSPIASSRNIRIYLQLTILRFS